MDENFYITGTLRILVAMRQERSGSRAAVRLATFWRITGDPC